MRGLIKAGGEGALAEEWPGLVTSERGEAPYDPIAAELSVLRDQATELTRQLADSRAEAARLKRDAEAAFVRGREVGEDLGRRSADTRSAERLSTIQQGATQALENFRLELTALERLAPLVAEAALAKILEPAEAQRDLIAKIIVRQIQGLEDQALLTVEVAAEDFPEPQELDALAALQEGVTIHAVQGLPSGSCRIRLALGTLEVGAGQQWRRLKELLEGLARSEGAQ